MAVIAGGPEMRALLPAIALLATLTSIATAGAMEHAVIVHLELSDDRFGSPEERESISKLEDRLAAAIDGAGAGEFDGDEYGQGECVLYMYGPDADRLFAVLEPVIKESRAARGGYAIVRYGEASDPHARDKRVTWD